MSSRARKAPGNEKGVSSSRLQFATIPRASSRDSRRKIKDGIVSPWIHKKHAQLQSSKIAHKIPIKESTRKSRRVAKREYNQYVKFFEDEKEKTNVQSLNTKQEFKNSSIPSKSEDLKENRRQSSRAKKCLPSEPNEESSEGKGKQMCIEKFNDPKLELSTTNGDIEGSSHKETELSNGQEKHTSIDKSKDGLTFDSSSSLINGDIIDNEEPSAKKFKRNDLEKVEVDVEDIAVDVSLGIEVKADTSRSWCSIA